MPIIDLQRRSRELGRIRMGQKVIGRNGKSRPEKLDRFRVTSASQALIVRVAELYGGEVHEWDNSGTVQYEVIIEKTRLPILVPPRSVSQFYELWSGGGCQRRCDGETELLTDSACLCGPDPAKRDCKPTTRLNVILRDLEGIGVFRLESHGYYSAVELPDVAEFLSRTGGYAPAWLSMEQRTAIREGKTRHWMVPILEVDITPAALLAGNGRVAQIEPGTPAVPASKPPAPVAEVNDTETNGVEDIDGEMTSAEKWSADILAATSIEANDSSGLRWLWHHRPSKTLPPEAEKLFTARAAELRPAAEAETIEAPPEAEPPASVVDSLWTTVLTGAPEDWSTTQVERHFTETTGVDPARASIEDMKRYLDAGWPVTEVNEAVS